MDSCTFVYEGSTACPRPAVGGLSRCLFHLPPAHRRAANLTENDLREAFRMDIRSSDDRRREYNGVVIEDVDLDFSLLVVDADDLSRLRFRNCTFDGSLSLVGSVVRHPIDLIECSIVHLDLTGSTLEHDVTVQDTHLGAEDDSITCLTARKATFERSFRLERTEISGSIEFAGGTVEDWLDIDRVTVDGRVHFPNAHVQHAQFIDVDFGDTVEFVGLRAGHLAFERTRFATDPTLDEAILGRIRCRPAGDVTWSFRGATLESGRLLQSEEGVAYYDLAEATVGPVDLDCSAATFDRYRFMRTRFDGFHFAAYRDLFRETGWTLDEYAGTVPAVSVPDLELTYLEAKRGATADGDNESASAFFVREMRLRRARYGEHARNPSRSPLDRLDAATRWATNGFLDLIAGYGELPERIVGATVAVIVGAALIYPAIGGLLTGGQRVTYASAGLGVFTDSLYFSVVTFTTLGLGDVQPASMAGRILAGSEALAGAFLMALFVFALGRRVTR